MRHLPTTVLPFLLLFDQAPAQPNCDGRGSDLRPARWEAGLPLLCQYAPDAPGFRLFTPEHRELVPRAGMQPGEAHIRRQLIVRYRCTGLWLLPVVISEVRAYGYVLDVEEQACAVESTPSRG